MEDTISSLSSVVEEIPDNLLFVSEHSEQHLLNCISNRLVYGHNYTYAGPILISISSDKALNDFSLKQRDSYSENSTNEPHLYSVSSKALSRLKETKKSQVISLLGYSGAGKTFAAIHLLDHLIHDNPCENGLFPMIHSGIQIIHVMGSINGQDNTESTVSGLITTLHYDSTYKIIGADIKAKLLDYALPSSDQGNTYHILHSLVTTSKTQLQALGLSSFPSFQIFNHKKPSQKILAKSIHNFERLVKNLNSLQFTRGEIQEIFEMLSCVILLFEIKFVGSSFIVAGNEDYVEWTPRHRSAIQKLCKLLMVSEEKFLEGFQGIQHKTEVENKVKELARALYNITFEWVVMKVNLRLEMYSADLLRQRLEKFKPAARAEEREKAARVLNIAIIDFPGFHTNSNIGGFTSNLAFECLNLFAADKLVGLLNSLKSDKINMNILTPPISKDLITVLMGKESGLLQSLDLENFEKYWKDFRSKYKDCAHIETTQTSVIIRYTWGEIEYDICQLREQAIKFTHHSEFNSFFNRCSNPLVKRLISTSPLSISEMFRKDISVLLEPLVSYDNSIVYFIKAPNRMLNYNETIRVLRNTLVIPCLIWEWYGYKHWVSNANLMAELLKEPANSSQAMKFVNSILAKWLQPGEYLVGLKYTLLKDHAFKVVTQKTAKTQSDIAEASYEAFSPKNPKKIIRATSSKIINLPENLFEFLVHGEKPYTESGIYEYLESVVDINEMSFKKENFSKVSAKLSKNSSAANFRASLQTVQSKKHFKTLKPSVSNFKLFNYGECLSSIVMIQKMWKGHQARKYYNAYTLLRKSAEKIQATWKSHKAKQAYTYIKASVEKIQKAYKRIFQKKTAAAILIQRFFKKFKAEQVVSRNLSSIASTISDPGYPLLHTAKRSLLKPSKTVSESGTYQPVILNYSRTLAKQREEKLGNKDLPVEKRLEIMNLLKKNKIDDLRKSKIDEERSNLKATPSINKNPDFENNFLQRQEIKSQQIRMKRDLEYLKKQAEEKSELTFKPSLCKFRPGRSVEKSISDLHKWAELKKAELGRAQKAKAEEESRSVSPFTLSNRSKKILVSREKKISETNKTFKEYQEKMVPYWPNKDLDNSK